MTGRSLRALADCLENRFMTDADRKAWIRDLRAHAKGIDRGVLLEVVPEHMCRACNAGFGLNLSCPVHGVKRA